MLKKIFNIFIVGLLISLTMTGCAKSDSAEENTDTSVTLESIQLTLADGTTAKRVPVGVSGDIIAIAHYSDSTSEDITSDVTPLSSNDNVIGIADKRLLALSEGASQITVHYEGVTSNNLTITVASATVVLQSIAVSPAGLTLPIDATATYTATGTYSDGLIYDITNDVNWSSNDTAIATMIDAQVKAITAGSTTITATDDSGVTGATELTVSVATLSSVQLTFADGTTTKKVPVGVTGTVRAVAYYSDGTSAVIQDPVPVSDNTTVVEIKEGNLYALAEGTAGVTVTYQGIRSNKITVNVENATVVLQSITISSDEPELIVGTSTILTAMGTYSNDTTVDITDDVNWQSANTDILTIVSNKAQGISAGTTDIIATLDSIEGRLEMKVNQAQVTALKIVNDDGSASSNEFVVGETIKVKALADFDNGMKNIDVTTKVMWQAGNQGTVSVDQNGLITALSAGNAEVTAYYQGEFGQASDTITGSVVDKVLNSIQIFSDPANATVPAGESIRLEAWATYNDGSNQNISDTVKWTSNDPKVRIDANKDEKYVYATADENLTATIVAEHTTEIQASKSITFEVKAPDHIEIQEGYCGDGNCTVITGDTIDIPIVDRVDYENKPEGVYYPTAWLVFSDGSKEYINDKLGIRWWSADQIRAYVNTTKGSFVFGRGLGEGIEISVSYRGEHKTSFFVNVKEDTSTKTLKEVGIINTQEYGWGCSQIDEDYGERLTMLIGDEGKYLMACGKFQYTDGSEQWEDINNNVAWLSSDSDVARVQNYTGELKALGGGTAIITAQLAEIKGQLEVIVEDKTISHIEIQEGYREDGSAPIITATTVDIPIVDDVAYNPTPIGTYYPTAWLVFTDGTKQYINTTSGIRWWSADQIRAYVNTTKGSFVFGRGLGNSIEISVSYRGENRTSFFVNVKEDTTTKTLRVVGIKNTKDLGWGCTQNDADYGTPLSVQLSSLPRQYLQACGKFEYNDETNTTQWEDINDNVLWTTTDRYIAYVRTINGKLKTVKPGNVTIGAQVAGVNGNIGVTVDP